MKKILLTASVALALFSCSSDDASLNVQKGIIDPPVEIRECDCPVRNIRIFLPTMDTIVYSTAMRHYNDDLCGKMRRLPLTSDVPGIFEYWTIEDCRGL